MAGCGERGILPASPAERVALDASAADVEGVTGETGDVKHVYHRLRAGDFFCGGGREPSESVHRDDLDSSRHA